MQRSQVKQFRASGIFQSTLLGTHSILALKQHSFQPQLALLTSRIQHGPESSVDLTNEPKVVIVFQAIQIQRLSTQISLLRGRLRQREDKVINANSYQVQIKELVDRCNRLQNQKYSFRQELGQTKDMNEMLFNELTDLKGRYEEVDFSASEKYKLEKARNEELVLEIEKWKNRYSALDRTKTEETDSIRKAIDLQRESQINTGSKELILRFEVEREQLLGKLRLKKQELNEKQLELKKVMNYYEQAQIRLQEQEHSIEEYQQKVAMLSQQTYRLNELLRIKGEEIKNLKMTNENDLSLRLSQFTVMDQTKNKLNIKLKSIEQNNEQLREALKAAENHTAKLKIKASEAQRLEYQVRQARIEAESKMKAMQRKDKKIFGLEEQIRRYKTVESELASFKKLSKDLGDKIQDLQVRIAEKIVELRNVSLKFQQLQKDYTTEMFQIKDKLEQYEQFIESINQNYQKMMSNEADIKEKSSYLELQMRENALNLKEKDYKISSLESELRETEAKMKTAHQHHSSILRELEDQLARERRTFQLKNRDAEAVLRKQMEVLEKEKIFRNRDYEVKLRQSDKQIREIQSRYKELQVVNLQKEEKIDQLKSVVSRLMRLQDDLIRQQDQISGEINSFHLRLNRIESILGILRNSLSQRYRAAQENQQRLRSTQSHVDSMQEWFFKIAEKLNQPPSQYSPSISPKKRQSDRSISPPRSRPFFSPEVTPTYQHNYAQSASIYGLKEIQSDSRTTTSPQELPVEWLLRFVLLCAEVQSLRKKVGDKQAKVQSMKTSIASKVGSSSTLINHLHGSHSSTQSGFLTTRENTMNRKPNIYY